MKQVIKAVLNILSSRDKFINNVCGCDCVVKKRIIPLRPDSLVDFVTYSAHTKYELEDFYNIFKLRGYDKLKIMRVVEVDNRWKYGCFVELAKDYDNFSLYVEMFLDGRW